ncbi:MAG: DUF2490 domain-containing protein [Erythrobacter sp.]
MTLSRSAALALAASTIAIAQPALATDEDVELWFGPSIEKRLDENTSVELQTAQRFRDSERRRGDTFYFRGWVHQKVADNVTISAAAEQRFNSDGADEIRIIQQIGTKHGYLRTRLRLEERFEEGEDGRAGVRLRPRLGLRVPFSETSPVTAAIDGELFWTLRSTDSGGSTGFTDIETRIGFTYDVSDDVTVGLKYVRGQSFRSGRDDKVGHAPLIELDIVF